MLGFLRSDRFFYFGFVLCVLFLFYPGLLFSQVPAFRDGFLFYYPQAQWQDYWLQRGDYFPSWNSLSGFGYSVPGQVSSALYYPLRILWLLDLFTVEQRYAAFLAVHVLIAALLSLVVLACFASDFGYSTVSQLASGADVLSRSAYVALGILCVAAFLWITEAIPLFVTSLFVLFLCLVWLLPTMNSNGHVIDRTEFLQQFFSDIILLFLGGFTLSAALPTRASH